MRQGFPSQKKRLVTVLTNSTLITGAFCYPGTRSLYSIPDLSPKKSRRSHDDFNDQYGHDSHNKFTAFGQAGKGLILPGDLSCGRHQNRDGLFLRMPFITLNYADIRFAESSSADLHGCRNLADDQASGTL